MRKSRFTILILFVLISSGVYSQVEMKTEYISSKKYKNSDKEYTGGKGSASISSIKANIPLSFDMDENNQIKMWAIGLGVDYTSFDNKNISSSLSPEKMLNMSIGVTNIQPLTEKLSIITSLGLGSYTAHTRIGHTKLRNMMINGALIFVWKLRDNLKLGIGGAVGSMYGYPSIMPVPYFEWTLDGRFEVNVNLTSSLELSAGMRFTDYAKVKFVTVMDGSLALKKIDGKKMMFNHQYMVVGLQPEFNYQKFTVPITLGVNVFRKAQYKRRKFKESFKSKSHPKFDNGAFYFAIGLRYNFI